MNKLILATAIFLNIHCAFAADGTCLTKYKVITQDFYAYNEKSATANAIMDRIATYTDGADVTSIIASDAKAWRSALEDAVSIGQPMLQNFLEYQAYGCSPDQQKQLSDEIAKLTSDLKTERANVNALVSGLPAEAFR